MTSWNTWFHPIFQRKEAAKRAVEALARFANLVKIPKNATWRVFPRRAGLFVTAEWARDDRWLGNICLICGESGTFSEHVHSYGWYSREKESEDENDAKAGPETLENGLRTVGQAARDQ